MLTFHPGNHIGSGEATHKLVVELRNDGNSGSPKEIIEDETIHNQIVVKGKRAPIKKEVLKPKTKELDGKKEQAVEENYSSQAEQSVEENYSRQAEESVDSVSPIVYNISTIDEKLKKNQGAEYISSLLFATLQFLLCFLYQNGHLNLDN